MAFLKVDKLSKTFGTLQVLREITFSMERGEVLAIIGSSGSGKTTLLRCLNFLETPSGGAFSLNDEVLFDAADQSTHSDEQIRRKRLHFGMVFQNFNLFPQYTALGNVMLAPTLQKKRAEQEIEDTAKALLERVGLGNKMDFYPCQLSGGQQQRVAIARALALHPDILCFDEPTSALDPELTGEVLRVIKGLKSEDSTMIVVTHEMEFAKNVADRVIFMADGVIEEEGAPQELFENPRSEKLRAFLAKSLEEI